MVALGVDGRLAYTEVDGDMPPGVETRKIPGLSEPAPVQVSVVKRSPLSGSIEILVGQVNPAETVLVTAPVEGLICITAPVVKLPVVTSRLANKLPLPSKARPDSVTPSEVLVSNVLGPATPPPGGNL